MATATIEYVNGSPAIAYNAFVRIYRNLYMHIIPTVDMEGWQVSHPLESHWNLCFAPSMKRRAILLRFMRQRYCDYARRGKGNKAWKRVEAMSRRADILHWPEYLRNIEKSYHEKTSHIA